jgi:hypothetical protein
MRRREFLIGAAAATGLVSRLRAEGASASRLRAQGAIQAKLDRVAILSSNFDKILKAGAGLPSDPARTLDIMDLAQTIADRFGVHRLELEHAHFLSTEAAYLKDLKDRVAKAKSQITQINTEFQGSNASAGGFSARAQAIDLVKQWIDHAEALGCPRVMVNPGTLAENVRQNAIEALKIMGEYGRAHKVTVRPSSSGRPHTKNGAVSKSGLVARNEKRSIRASGLPDPTSARSASLIRG